MSSSELPRFCCANHKLNLCIRHAMEKHICVSKIIRILNQTNSSIKRSVIQSEPFRNKKCRLRLENATRWSSGFLMLESTVSNSISSSLGNNRVISSNFKAGIFIECLFQKYLRQNTSPNIYQKKDDKDLLVSLSDKFVDILVKENERFEIFEELDNCNENTGTSYFRKIMKKLFPDSSFLQNNTAGILKKQNSRKVNAAYQLVKERDTVKIINSELLYPNNS
ncbi:unnamed protein product, partial [Brachionus calyciflorus]